MTFSKQAEAAADIHCPSVINNIWQNVAKISTFQVPCCWRDMALCYFLATSIYGLRHRLQVLLYKLQNFRVVSWPTLNISSRVSKCSGWIRYCHKTVLGIVERFPLLSRKFPSEALYTDVIGHTSDIPAAGLFSKLKNSKPDDKS